MARQMAGPSRPGSIQSMMATSLAPFVGRLEPAVAVVKHIHIVLVARQRAGNQRVEFLVVYDDKDPHERY